MFDWLQEATSVDSALTLQVTGTRLLIAALLGLAVSAMYFSTQRRPAAEIYPVAATMAFLTVLVAMTTLVIGSSVARAFSLVGVLSIVRFRTVVDDTRDTAFVIFAVVIGMAVGTGDLRICAAGMPIVGGLSLLLFVVERFAVRPGGGGPNERKLEIRIARDCDPETLLADVFRLHLTSCRLVSATTAKQGQSLDLHYAVKLLKGDAILPLLRALTATEGVVGVELK